MALHFSCFPLPPVQFDERLCPIAAAAVGRAKAASVLLLLERNSCSAATAALPVPGLKLGEKLRDFSKAASTSFHTSPMASCITWCKFSIRVKPVIHSIFFSEEPGLFGTPKIICSAHTHTHKNPGWACFGLSWAWFMRISQVLIWKLLRRMRGVLGKSAVNSVLLVVAFSSVM